jgi:hypothetical protein
MKMLRRRLRLAIAFACGCLLLPGGATARAATPPSRDFFGINVNRLFNDGLPADEVDRQLDIVERAGLTTARADAMWEWVQPQGPPQLLLLGNSWTETDRRMTALASHHIQWQPVLDYTPPWQQTVAGDDKSAPKSNDAYAQFAALFAGRYGPGGSFWTSHPELPYLPVRTYEIWNEPNGAFWTPQPDPADYADLFVRAADAIHAQDRGATVMIGGLVDDGGTFLRSVFTLRPDVAGRADAIAYHPYAPTVDGVMHSIDVLEDTLAQLGQGSLPVYINEVGWMTSGAPGVPLVMPDSMRASNMTDLVPRIASARESRHIVALLPYTFWTPEQNPGDGEDWYGLWHADGTATLAGDAYVKAVARALATPPAAATGAARPGEVPQTAAVVTGAVNPGGCSATWSVQYATDAAYRASGGYDQRSSTLDAGAGGTDVPVSAQLTGLQPNTTYHYRLVAGNACSYQTAEGSDATFTTAPPNDLTITRVIQGRDGTLTVSGSSGWGGRVIAKASTIQRAKAGTRAADRKGARKLKTLTYGTGFAATPAAGRFRLKVKPARRVQALLRKGTKLRVSIAVTFSPAGGTSNTKAARVNVKLKGGKKKGR